MLRIVEPRDAADPVRRGPFSRLSSQGRHEPRRRNLADRLIPMILHVDIAGRVRGYTPRLIEPGGVADPIRRARFARLSSQGGHESRGRNPTDSVITTIRHIDVAGVIRGYIFRFVEACGAADPVCRAPSPGFPAKVVTSRPAAF